MSLQPSWERIGHLAGTLRHALDGGGARGPEERRNERLVTSGRVVGASIWVAVAGGRIVKRVSAQNRLQINWVNSAGGALGAVSSAVLLSSLGAAGTLVGAALGSLCITV